MNKISRHILRIGLAITFLWVGIYILRAPEGWGSVIQPWALHLLPLPLREMMISTAWLDIVVCFLLLINRTVWVGALLGALHLTVVLITVGIGEITVRDIGLLAASVALFVDTLPLAKAVK